MIREMQIVESDRGIARKEIIHEIFCNSLVVDRPISPIMRMDWRNLGDS